MRQDIGGYLVTPEKGAGPAVIVVPDDPDYCDRLAAEGFTAMSPAGDVAAALDFLKPHPEVRGHGIGVVGFGAAAGEALSLAAGRPDDVVAVVVYSGDAERARDGAGAGGRAVPEHVAVQEHETDDRDSWIRTLEFLRKHLG